ncbi:MAG: glutaredoxin family protein [Candidatus Berkiella sp.]
MTISPKLTLYIGTTCPYCWRVTDFLKSNSQNVTIKDVWQDEEAYQEMLALTQGKTQVPCLRIDDTYMHESLDIIEKLRSLK